MTTNPDFQYVPEAHRVIDERLSNWAAYVQVKSPSWVSPIWKLGKSNGRQWHQPEFRPACDVLDGMAIEKAVSHLPEPHRSSMRWFYVYRYSEQKFRREAGLTRDGLVRIVNDARLMLINRRV